MCKKTKERKDECIFPKIYTFFKEMSSNLKSTKSNLLCLFFIRYLNVIKFLINKFTKNYKTIYKLIALIE